MMGGGPRQIIGIVGDVHDAFLNREPRIYGYMPLSAGVGGLEGLWAWVIRTRGTPTSLSSAIEKELREASAGLPVWAAFEPWKKPYRDPRRPGTSIPWC